jgi:hypothetical protein
MLRRLGELRRAAAFRVQHGVPLGEPETWAMLIADVCLYHRDGCDLFTFREVQRDGVWIRDDVAMAAIHRVCRVAAWKGVDYRPISAATAGKMLGITAEERWACDIRTMRAVDETPADAKADRRVRDRGRKREERSMADAADRERERERGRRRRAAKGAKPRARYLAEAHARREQWEAQGISRRTWERRRAASPSTPARDASPSVRLYLSSYGERTDGLATTLAAAPVGKSNGERSSRRERRLPAKAHVQRNGRRRPPHQRVAVKKRVAEQDLPLRPDGTVSPEWAARELVTFDGAVDLTAISIS